MSDTAPQQNKIASCSHLKKQKFYSKVKKKRENYIKFFLKKIKNQSLTEMS